MSDRPDPSPRRPRPWGPIAQRAATPGGCSRRCCCRWWGSYWSTPENPWWSRLQPGVGDDEHPVCGHSTPDHPEGNPTAGPTSSPSSRLPPDRPDFSPMGSVAGSVVEAKDAETDRAAGINTYVGITRNSDVSLVREPDADHRATGGMADADAGSREGFAAVTLRRVGHEPSNRWTAPVSLERVKKTLPEGDGRLHYNNYGKVCPPSGRPTRRLRFCEQIPGRGLRRPIYWVHRP
jgi:hypothetical protein